MNMMNSEARKKKHPIPSEHNQAALEIGSDIREWLVENQDFLMQLTVTEALALVSLNMGIITGTHASR